MLELDFNICDDCLVDLRELEIEMKEWLDDLSDLMAEYGVECMTCDDKPQEGAKIRNVKFFEKLDVKICEHCLIELQKDVKK